MGRPLYDRAHRYHRWRRHRSEGFGEGSCRLDQQHYHCKPTRELRNRFAHHVWACSFEINDALLLIHPKEFDRGYADTIAQLQKGDQPPHEQYPNLDRSRVMVYREKDLLDGLRQAHNDEALVHHLTSLVQGGGEQVRDLLRKEPRIQEALLRNTKT